ncbi:ketopantoate reductase family protein [Hansschlegelia zhihuaiae]|uniref:2-dehydropantoate 2-reductase n=1 Tax=Hansschlegelia zhihuaiae TaxID=405005 RepID=A0A4Q0MPT4_9HYPH|nr:ketopantoate reductase family protein [Hansschlegelia zhihuaiae]RXF75633.1 ketopantoate reductase family protein [Hansschlegelia zhihuaiae]
MRILIVGAGATGGYFGGRLAQAGRDVTFLARPARAERLRTTGLEIVSPHGDFTIHPKLATAETLDGPFDVVFLTVKAFALEQSLEDVAPAVGPATAILPFLNGMRHVDRISARFGPDAAAGCVCKVAATLDDKGRIVQLSGLQEIAYGELAGGVTDRMRRIDETLRGAGFATRLSADIESEMWAKWALLSTLAATTCLLRGAVGEIVAAPGGADTALRILDEVTGAISRVGKAVAPETVQAIRAMLTEQGSKQTASLYRDILIGSPVEADQVVGDLVDRARSAGLTTPLLAAAYAQLSIYNGRRPLAPSR